MKTDLKWPFNEFPEDESTWRECVLTHTLVLAQLEDADSYIKILLDRIKELEKPTKDTEEERLKEIYKSWRHS